MKFNKLEILKLRLRIQNIDDLKKILDEEGISYTEKNLQELYETINTNQELDIDELDGVAGGANIEEYTEIAKVKCKKCGKRYDVSIWGWEKPCPYCGTLNKYVKKKKRSFFGC